MDAVEEEEDDYYEVMMQEMESYNTPTISTAHNRNRNSLISAPSPPPPPAAAASVTSIAASESIATVGGGGGGGDNNIPPAAPFDPLKWMGLHSLNRHLLSDPVKGTAGWIRCMTCAHNLILMGTSRSLILIYSITGAFKGFLGSADQAPRLGQVTALTTSPNSALVAVGFSSGSILVYDLTKRNIAHHVDPAVAPPSNHQQHPLNAHAKGAAVILIKFVGNKNLVSCDLESSAFYHTIPSQSFVNNIPSPFSSSARKGPIRIHDRAQQKQGRQNENVERHPPPTPPPLSYIPSTLYALDGIIPMKVLDGGSSSKPLAVVRVGGATAAAAGIVSLMGGGGSSSISALSSSSSSKRKSFGGVSGEVKLVPLMRDGRGYFALASPYKLAIFVSNPNPRVIFRFSWAKAAAASASPSQHTSQHQQQIPLIASMSCLSWRPTVISSPPVNHTQQSSGLREPPPAGMTLAASCNNRVYLFESQFVSDIFLAAGRRIAPTSVEDEVEFRLVAEYSVNDDDYTEGATSYGLTTAAGVGGEADVGEVGAGSGNIVMMGWISDTLLFTVTASEKLTIYNYLLKTVIERSSIRGFEILNYDHHSESLKDLIVGVPFSATNTPPPPPPLPPPSLHGAAAAGIQEQRGSLESLTSGNKADVIRIYPEMAYSGSTCVYRNRIFMLSQSGIRVGSLQAWDQRLTTMTKSGHFPAALARALEFYDNTSVLAVTQLPPPPHPSDTPNERDAAIHLHRAVVGEFVAGMVASYVNMAVSGYDPSSATMQQQSHPADGKDATAGNGVSDAGGGGSSAIFNGQPLQSAHYLLTIADVDGRSSSSSSGILPNTSSDALDSSLLESIAAPNLHQSDFILVFKSLILLVIQVYVRIDRLDVLFGEVFEKISEADSDQTTKSAATSWSNTINKRLTNIFIEVLEPFILKGDIQVICNPQVMNALLDYFNMLATSATIASHSSTNNNPSSSLFSLSSSTSSSPPSLTSTELVRRRLENVITSLDLNAFSFDLHHAVQVCRRLKIYTALVYIYSVAVKDYITPIIELMLLVQDLAGSIESTSKLYSSTWFDPAATIITTASLNGNNSNINSNTTDASKIEAAAQVTYLLFFYLASTLSGRIFPTAVVMDQPEATRAKSAVYNFLFSPDFMSWDSLGINAHTVGKLLAVSGTNNNQGGNNIEGDDVYDASDAATSFYIGFHPPFPYVRRLLLLDSNEFMKVIGIAFEDDMLSGGELTIDDDSTTTTTTTTSTFTSPSSRGFDRRQMSQITRQFILDALFSVLEGTVSHKPTGGQFTSVFTRSAFSKSDLMALYGFVARNYGRYSTFLYFDEDTLKRMVSLLVNFDGDNPSLSSSSSTTITSTSISRSEREVSILALLNSFNLSYKGAELDQLTSECETKQLWRVCESIYRKEHKFERILACYLYDPHRKASAFSCVRQLFENGDLNFETSLAVKREFIELVADYVSISGSATAAVVEDYFPNDHQTCISRLEKSGGEILLDYLSGLFETQLDFLLEWKRTGNSQDDVEFHLIRDETGSCSGGGKFDLSAKKQPVVGATRYKLYPSYFYDKAIELLLIYNKMIILPFIKHLYDVYGRIPVGSVEKILASLTAARVVNATCFVLEKSGRVQEALSVLLDTYNEVWELYYEQKFKDNKPAPQPQMTLDHLLAPPAQLKDGAKSDAYTVAPASGTSSIGGGWKKIFTASMRDIQLDYVLKKAISLIYCHSGNMNTVIQQGLWLSLLGVVLQDRSPSQYSTEESTITLSLSDSSPTAAMLGKRTFSIESCKFVMEAMVGYVPLPKILSHTLDKEREPVHLSDYKDIITSLIENYFFEKNLLVSANRLMGQYVSAVNRTNMKARAVGVACLGTKQSGICQACKKPVVSTSAMSSHSTETDESRQKQQQQQEWFKGLVVFYYCRHVYHERCLLSPSTQGAAIPQHRRGNLVQCPVCNPYGEQEEVEVEEVSKGKAIRDQETSPEYLTPEERRPSIAIGNDAVGEDQDSSSESLDRIDHLLGMFDRYSFYDLYRRNNFDASFLDAEPLTLGRRGEQEEIILDLS